METVLLLQLILSLIGGGLGGAFVSYYLDKTKRRQAKEEEKIGMKNGTFTEIRSNLDKIETAIEKNEKLQDVFFNNSLDKLGEHLSLEELKKINSTYEEIRKFNECIQVLKTNFNESSAIELKKEIPTLRSKLIDAYEIFAPDDINRYMAIIKGENIPIEGGGICGHYGIATPEIFLNELNKYGARYIDPIDVLDLKKIDKFKIIINPYGEDYFLTSWKDYKQPIDTIKKFVDNGGIWVHIGGYPFWKAINLKDGKARPIESLAAEHFGLKIKEGPGGKITTTSRGKYIIGDMTWNCIFSRSLENSDEVYAVASTGGGEMNILSSLNIGKGKFIHYGGKHLDESEFVAKTIICKFIKYLAIVLNIV